MKFSICIPNYNYERYLGRTIQSVLDQQDADFEVLISDNSSTDGSLKVARSFADPRIQVRVNAMNVGFSANLDRAARMAGGDYLIMLSSDDLILPGALATYEALLAKISGDQRDAVISSTWNVISSDDAPIGRDGPKPEIWTAADRLPELDDLAGGPVYRVAGDELLRRCMRRMRNPFNFAATCYSRALYERVEGYGGNRLMNPDKAFHWKLLSVAKEGYFVDRAWFAYRVHDTNQQSQESAASALKFLVDEYVSTLELEAGLLARIGISRDEVLDAFVEYDIGRHGLATLARGGRQRARRILQFGRAVYPRHVRRNRRAKTLALLLALGPVGQKLAERAYRARGSMNGTPKSP
jgi:glycosyltransferase involved in cell wall biosynthesis